MQNQNAAHLTNLEGHGPVVHSLSAQRRGRFADRTVAKRSTSSAAKPLPRSCATRFGAYFGAYFGASAARFTLKETCDVRRATCDVEKRSRATCDVRRATLKKEAGRRATCEVERQALTTSTDLTNG